MHAGHYILIAQIITALISLVLILKYSSKFAEAHNHDIGPGNFSNSHEITRRREAEKIKSNAEKLDKKPASIRKEIKRSSRL